MKTVKIMLFLFCIAIFLLTIYSLIKVMTTFEPDFSIFYSSAYDVVHHISPYKDKSLYTAFNYPLVTTIFFIPFSLLPHSTSQIIFTLLSFLAALLAVFFSFKLLKQKITISFFVATALFLFAFPTKFTFGMGQVNIIALAILLCGFFLFTKNKIKASLALLLCAIFLKPILAITLLVFVFEKKWRYLFFLLFFLAAITILFPLIVQQPHANLLFLQNQLHQTLVGRDVYYNQGLLGFVSRAITNKLFRFIFNIVGIIIIFFITFLKLPKLSFVKKISLLLTTLLLIDPLSWQHHFVFLLLPFLVVWFAIIKIKTNKIFFLILLVISYLLVAWNFKNPQLLTAFPLSLLLSNQFYGAFLLFVLQLILL